MSAFWEAVGGGFFGSVLGVVGSEFSRRLFEPRTRREARRDHQLEACLAHLEKIETGALRYWGQEFEANSREVISAEAMIVALLHSLANEASELFQGDAKTIEYCDEDIRRLRQLVTGGNFGDEDPTLDKRKLRDITAATSELRRALTRRRHEQKQGIF